MIRIIIADDQELFAENLKIMLETLTQDLSVIGIALDGAQAVKLARELNPDLILMDIRMPNLNGMEATRDILKTNPHQKILIITSFQEGEYASKLLKFGVAGYLLKNMHPQNLIAAIRAVHEGMTLLSDTTAMQLFGPDEEGEKKEQLLWYKKIYISMNNREREVLKLMIQGRSNKQIAQELYLSEATIRNYISAIYTKFDNNNRMEVIGHGKKVLEYFSDG